MNLTYVFVLCIFPDVNKFFPVLFLLPVTMIGFLTGCGGGSGKSGDDGNVSLSGQQMSLFEGGNMLFRLQFRGQNVDVTKMETRTVYDGVYTYRFNGSANSGFLHITPASNSRSACCMTDVNISFDDSERSTGVIESGTITETGLDLDPSIDGVARPMAGWTCRVHRD